MEFVQAGGRLEEGNYYHRRVVFIVDPYYELVGSYLVHWESLLPDAMVGIRAHSS